MPNCQPPVNNYQPLVNEEFTYHLLRNAVCEEVRPFDSIDEMNEFIPCEGMSNENTKENNIFHLNIIEQPADTFRYRYKSEKGSHGGIKGENAAHSKKSFPVVKLENCPPDLKKKVVIKVSLYTNEPNPKPHVYELIGKNASGVTLDEEFLANFKYLAICTRKKEEVFEILKERKKVEHDSNGVPYDEASVEAEAHEEMKNFNLDSAKLCFEAFSKDNWNIPLCEKIFSNPINNQKSAATGDLKIVRLSRCSGKCSGGDEVWLLCDKVKKDDIKVFFYDDEIGWQAEAEFSPNEIHHQVVIILKTPPYQLDNVTKTVLIKLVRPSDFRCSEGRKFDYIPDDNGMPRSKKMHNFQTASSVKNEPSEISRKRRRVVVEEDAGSSQSYLENSTVVDSPPSADDEPFSFDILKELGMELSLSQFFENSEILEDPQIFQDSPHEYSPIVGQMDDTSFADMSELPSQDLHIMYPQCILPSIVMADGFNEVLSSMDSMSLDDRCQRQEVTVPNVRRASDDFVAGMKRILQSRGERTYLQYATRLIPLQDENGNSMLHLGIVEQNENLNFISKMVKMASEDVINTQNKFKETPLHLSVKGNHVKILFLLLYRGGDPDIPDKNGNNCLHLAAKYGYIDCLKLLLPPSESQRTWKHAISDIDTLNYDGMSSLHLAVMGNFQECVNFLLKSNADVNLSEMKSGRTSLHLALEKPSLLQIILNQPDIDIGAEDFGGCTALQLACLKAGKPFDVVCAEMEDMEKISKFLLSLNYSCEESDEDSSEFEDAVEDFDSDSSTEVIRKAISERKCTNEKKSSLMQIEEELHRYLDRGDNWKKLGDLIGMNTRCVAQLDEGLSPGQTVLREIKDLYHPCHLQTMINILKVAGLEEGAQILEDNS